MKTKQHDALILASGGIDSLTAISIALHEGKTPLVLSFNYGQRNKIELEHLSQSLKQFERRGSHMQQTIGQIVIDLDLSCLTNETGATTLKVPQSHVDSCNSADDTHHVLLNTSMLDSNYTVKKYQAIADLPKDSVPNTYVPGRNTLFASYALAVAEARNIPEIWLGIHKQDAPNYPDCTLEYLHALNNLVQIASRGKIRVLAPLINESKEDIIRLGKQMGVDYSNTISCYDPVDESACLACHSCIIRIDALRKNGLNHN